MIFDIGYNYKIKHIMVFYSADDEYSVYSSHGKYYEVVKGFGADNSSDIGLREFDENYFEELVHRFDFSSEQKTVKEVCLIDKNERELIRHDDTHIGNSYVMFEYEAGCISAKFNYNVPARSRYEIGNIKDFIVSIQDIKEILKI